MQLDRFDQSGQVLPRFSGNEDERDVNTIYNDMVDAARSGKKKTFKRLFLQLEGILDSSSMIMQRAVKRDQTDLIRMLFKECDVDANTPLSKGHTLMTAAASLGNAGIILLLNREFGVDVTSPGKGGFTPVTAAAEKGKPDIVTMLELAFNVDVTASDKRGYTPMTAAALGGQADVIRKLYNEAGVDINASDKKGRKPIDVAKDEATRQCIIELMSREKPIAAKESKEVPAPQPTKTRGRSHSDAGREANPFENEQPRSREGWDSDDSEATTVRPESSISRWTSTLSSRLRPSIRGLRPPVPGNAEYAMLGMNPLVAGSFLSSSLSHTGINAAETAEQAIGLFKKNIFLTEPQGESVRRSLDLHVAVQTGRKLRDSFQSSSQKSAVNLRILKHIADAGIKDDIDLQLFWKIVEEAFNKPYSNPRSPQGRNETRGRTTGPHRESYIGEEIPPGDFNTYGDYKMARLSKRFAMFQLTLATSLGIAGIAFPPLLGAAGGVALLNPQVLAGMKYLLYLTTSLAINPAALPEFKKKVKEQADSFSRLTQRTIDPMRKDKRFEPHETFLTNLSTSLEELAEKIQTQNLQQCLESTLQFEQETLNKNIKNMDKFGKDADKKQVHALQEFARKYDKYLNQLPADLKDMTRLDQLRLQHLVDTAKQSPLPELRKWASHPDNLAFNLARLRIVDDSEQLPTVAE